MPSEPSKKRVTAFIDGQNLFYAAKESFGHKYPNYDPQALVKTICAAQQWTVSEICFYTGVPDPRDNAFWHNFWSAKLAVMGKRGIKTYSRALKYRNQSVTLLDGSTATTLVGQEKGIDIRIALDVVHQARENLYDVALIFSQDQDLSEITTNVRDISVAHNRWIKLASAFPSSPTSRNPRGINGTEWITIDRKTYDSCIDLNDYRPKKTK